MSSTTSKKIVKNTIKKSISCNNDIDELDELDNMLDSIKEYQNNSNKTINSCKTISNKQQIFKNIKSDIQSKLIDETSDLYDIIELDNKPKNYGTRWSDEDKIQLIELLKQNQNKEINYNDIAIKLGRSEGGVKGEVKKMILTRYLNGEEADVIALDMNIQYKFIKILIKTYIENEIDADINNLEKENKLLKLKMENMELRKGIAKMVNKNKFI
jgi:hypothetical protein